MVLLVAFSLVGCNSLLVSKMHSYKVLEFPEPSRIGCVCEHRAETTPRNTVKELVKQKRKERREEAMPEVSLGPIKGTGCGRHRADTARLGGLRFLLWHLGGTWLIKSIFCHARYEVVLLRRPIISHRQEVFGLGVKRCQNTPVNGYFIFNVPFLHAATSNFLPDCDIHTVAGARRLRELGIIEDKVFGL